MGRWMTNRRMGTLTRLTFGAFWTCKSVYPAVVFATLCFSALTASAAEFPKFEPKTLDPDIGMATEDLTGDGKLDIVTGGRAMKNVNLYVQK